MASGIKELLWALLALAIAVLLAYILVITVPRETQSEETLPLQHSDYDERLDALDKRAIEQAYVAHIAQLFRTWMTDYSTNPTPFRAQKGHRNARQGYIDTMTAIEQRK